MPYLFPDDRFDKKNIGKRDAKKQQEPNEQIHKETITGDNTSATIREGEQFLAAAEDADPEKLSAQPPKGFHHRSLIGTREPVRRHCTILLHKGRGPLFALC